MTQNASPSAVQRLAYAPSDPEATPIRHAHVTVDAGDDRGVLARPWESIGYDEINWTYTPHRPRLLRTFGGFAETPYHVRPHYVFCSGSGFGIPHWGSGNVYHEDADGNPFYDFTIADQTYDAIVGAGHHRAGRAGVHPARPGAGRGEDEFAFESSPTLYSTYEAGAGPTRRRTTPSGAAWSRHMPSTAWTATARRRCRTGCGSCGTSPTSSTGAARRSSSTTCTTVTAEAVRSVLPNAQGRRARRSPAAGVEFLRGFLHCMLRARPAAGLRLVPHQGSSAFTPWRTYGRSARRRRAAAVAVDREDAARDRPHAQPVIEEFEQYAELPAIVDECDASVPGALGVYDNANFDFEQRVLPGVPGEADEEDPRPERAPSRPGRAGHPWSFSFEGERYFEGTRSFLTASASRSRC